MRWCSIKCCCVVCPVVFAILAQLAFFKLSTPEGGPIELEGAVPIYKNVNLSVANKVVEYVFPLLLPVGQLVACALDDDLCAKPMRETLKKLDDSQFAGLLKTHDETRISFERSKGPPLDIVLVRPKDVPANKYLPLVLWMHGGGLAVGTARDGYSVEIVQGMATHVPVVFASVEYSLIPAHPWPAAPDDCLEALQYLLKPEVAAKYKYRSDFGVHIGGVSAGGHLAIVTALRALKADLPVHSLFLADPMIVKVSASGSYRRNAYTRIAPVRWLEWCWQSYVRDVCKDMRKCEVDPFMGSMDSNEWKHAGKKGLPPAVLLTSTGDPMYDAQVAFAKVYWVAGGSVNHIDTNASHVIALSLDSAFRKTVISAWTELVKAAVSSSLMRSELFNVED